MNVEAIKEGVQLIEQGIAKFSGGPLDYYLKCLTKAYDLLLSKYAPFKPGDRVKLVKSINFESSHGWYGSRHFLVPGARGIVESSSCDSNGKLRFDIVFDDESWKDQKGEVHPVSQKHTYCFFEDDLAKEELETKEIWIEA